MYKLIYPLLAIEFIAAITATIFYSKYKHTSLKWLLPLLWYIPLNEVFCQFIVEAGKHIIFYNIYRVVTTIGILIITRNEIESSLRKKIMSSLIVISCLSYIINIHFSNPAMAYLEEGFYSDRSITLFNRAS